MSVDIWYPFKVYRPFKPLPPATVSERSWSSPFIARSRPLKKGFPQILQPMGSIVYITWPSMCLQRPVTSLQQSINTLTSIDVLGQLLYFSLISTHGRLNHIFSQENRDVIFLKKPIIKRAIIPEWIPLKSAEGSALSISMCGGPKSYTNFVCMIQCDRVIDCWITMIRQ